MEFTKKQLMDGIKITDADLKELLNTEFDSLDGDAVAAIIVERPKPPGIKEDVLTATLANVKHAYMTGYCEALCAIKATLPLMIDQLWKEAENGKL